MTLRWHCRTGRGGGSLLHAVGTEPTAARCDACCSTVLSCSGRSYKTSFWSSENAVLVRQWYVEQCTVC